MNALSHIERNPVLSFVANTPRSATDEIVIGRAEPEDGLGLHRLYSQPHIIANTATSPFARIEETLAWAKEMDHKGYLLVARAGDGVIAGALGLLVGSSPVVRHKAEICRVAVGAEFQGRGIASRLLKTALDLADNWLNLLRVDLMVRPDNPAAVGLYRKYGFLEEGLLRGYGYREGTYMDVLMMARLRGPLARVGIRSSRITQNLERP